MISEDVAHTKVKQIGWEWSQAVFCWQLCFSHWLDHAGSIAYCNFCWLPCRKKAGEYQELQNRKVLAIAVGRGERVPLHPGRLTWNLKITQLKRKIIFQTIIFRFHVNLQGSIWYMFISSYPRSGRCNQDRNGGSDQGFGEAGGEFGSHDAVTGIASPSSAIIGSWFLYLSPVIVVYVAIVYHQPYRQLNELGIAVSSALNACWWH